MADSDGRSAYPLPNDFEVMRPEYEDNEDGTVVASITVASYNVTGESLSRPGARRAALYEAHKTYRHYNPSYSPPCPYPDEFTDQEGVAWERLGPIQRATMGDYLFRDAEGEEDYASIRQMLMWDVRPS